MSALGNRIRGGFYLDSVALMRVSRAIASLEGVEAAALMIGSPSNQAILENSALLDSHGRNAVSNDLILAVRARDAAALEAAMEHAEHLLDRPSVAQVTTGLTRVRRLDTALARLQGANLALVSVPGEFAAFEGRRALAAGLHVVMFSDNVPVEDEIALKHDARRRGLLMMGPDCGTCIIAGVPIAFANEVPSGNIGIVSASGTGLQEVATLLARAGLGIAHGIGVGGRDLSAAVGGITTLMAIDALEHDPRVERIVLISKPPAASVVARVLARIGASHKPFVVCFIGCRELELPRNAILTRSLRAAAEACAGASTNDGWVEETLHGIAGRGGRMQGLFCGGTLCAEAQGVLLDRGLEVASNTPVPGARRLLDAERHIHVLLDLGDDNYTRGRPHPMIEPAIRSALIAQALDDRATSVLLLDVVIGYGAHADPAGIVAAELARRHDRKTLVVASVTGTELDPQRYSVQARTLAQAGVVVAPSNAHAAELAAAIVCEQATPERGR